MKSKIVELTGFHPSEYETKTPTATDVAVKHLGYLGDMVGGSKSIYRHDNPKNIVVFNSNVCTKRGKIWYGDIDVTKSYKKLKELSKELKERIYVLHEMDARFENETNPILDDAVVKIDGDEIILGVTGFYYIKRGRPYQLTQGEYAKEFIPEPVKAAEYSQADFVPYKLPDIKQFKGDRKKDISPDYQFEKFLVEKHGKTVAQNLYNNMYFRTDTDELFKKLITSYAKKLYPNLHPVKIEQSVAMVRLDMPMTFEADPMWSLPGYAYIKRSNK